MLKGFIEIFVIVVLGVEMYFCTAGNRHRKKKMLKGWNPAKGTVTAIEKKTDELSKKTVTELTIVTPDERTVYAKQDSFFCIYGRGVKKHYWGRFLFWGL